MHRHHYRATGDEIEVREPAEGEEPVFEVRLPIASTGEVRNEGDEPLTRDELDGMARQLDERQVGVFPNHGQDSAIAGSRYSPFERLGDWQAPEVQTRDASDLLVATARMPDPETLPAATGRYREALAILKEQATRGIGQDASIGWREDEHFPGGVDLMEASIVGIGADWRTNTGDEAAEVVARAAVDAGADPVAICRAVVDALDIDRGDVWTDTTEHSNDMTDEPDDPPEAGDTTADEPDERQEAPEWAERMLELQEDMTDTLQAVAEAVREDDGDEDEEDEDEEEEEQAAAADDADEGEEEPDDIQALRDDLQDQRDELAEVRQAIANGEADLDTGTEPDEEQAAEEDEEADRNTTDLNDKYGITP